MRRIHSPDIPRHTKTAGELDPSARRDPSSVSEAAAAETRGEILVREGEPDVVDKHEYASSCARSGTLPSYRDPHNVRAQDIRPDEGLERVCVRTWCGHDTLGMGHQDNPFREAGNRCLVRGICQWGSLERAVRGDNYLEILDHYQPALVVHRVAGERPGVEDAGFPGLDADAVVAPGDAAADAGPVSDTTLPAPSDAGRMDAQSPASPPSSCGCAGGGVDALGIFSLLLLRRRRRRV